MDDFDADVALVRAHKLLRYHRFKSYKTIIVPIVSHVGAILTIGLAWFNRVGYFTFSVDNWLDWFISFVLLVAFIHGSYVIVKQFVQTSSIAVKRKQLTDLVALARSEAEYSFINISGDLSWLKEDYSQLKVLKKTKPYLKMRIYYDAGDVSPENLEIMRRLINIGVEFIPYPQIVSTKMKCILVDKESVNHSRLFDISKIRTSNTVDPRDTDIRLWRAHTDRSSLTFKGIISFLDALDAAKPKPIIIGISGLNNLWC